MKEIGVFVFVLSLFFSCTEIEYEEKVEGYSVYRINEGGHKSSSEIRTFDQPSLEFLVRFDSSAMYDIGKNQSDINKLYGFNDCNQEIENHVHSARFGWRWFGDSLELFSYVYVEGNLLKEKLKAIRFNVAYQCKIQISDNSYLFAIDDEIVDTVPRGCNSLDVERRYLFPYFGGDEVAPHQITILIKDL